MRKAVDPRESRKGIVRNPSKQMSIITHDKGQVKPDFVKAKTEIAWEIAARLLMNSREEAEAAINALDPKRRALAGETIFPDPDCQAILIHIERLLEGSDEDYHLQLERILPLNRVRVWERRIGQVTSTTTLAQHIRDWQRIQEAEAQYLEGLTQLDKAEEALEEIDKTAFYTLQEENEEPATPILGDGKREKEKKKGFKGPLWRTLELINSTEGPLSIVAVATPSGVSFITGRGEHLKAARVGELLYRPPFGSEARKGIILFPTDVWDYPSINKLWESIVDFLRRYYEASSLEDYFLMSLYALTTWFMPVIPTVPILAFEGPSAKGKSRGQELVGLLSAYPYRTSGTRFASWLRTVDHYFPCTILIGEADFDRRSSEVEELVKFYNVRPVKAEAFIQRMVEGGRAVHSFNVFGATVVTLRQPFDDDAVERRSLKIKPKTLTSIDIPFNLPPKAYKEAERIRNQLAALSLEYMPNYQHRYLTLGDLQGRRIEPKLVQLCEGSLNIARILGKEEEALRALERITAQQKESIALTKDALIIRSYFALLCKEKEKMKTGVISSELAKEIEEFGVKLSPIAIGKRLEALGFVRIGQKYLLPRELYRERAGDYLPLDEFDQIQGELLEDGREKSASDQAFGESRGSRGFSPHPRD